jgi:hypothetical protein
MSRFITSIALGAGLLVCTAAFAHEGHEHGSDDEKRVKGTVTSFEGSDLKIKGTDGKLVNVHVDERTEYENSGAKAKAEDLKVGARVVVHGEKMNDGTLHATKVRFGKVTKKAQTKAIPAEENTASGQRL